MSSLGVSRTKNKWLLFLLLGFSGFRSFTVARIHNSHTQRGRGPSGSIFAVVKITGRVSKIIVPVFLGLALALFVWHTLTLDHRNYF